MGFAGENTVPVPGHLKRPGQDGYRTPTIEDVYYYHYGQHFQPQTDHDAPPVLFQACERLQNQQRHRRGSAGSMDTTSTERQLLPFREKDKINFKHRIKHFTWTYFSLTMATGGMANIIYQVPSDLRFKGLTVIGWMFMIINMIFFLINVMMISLRFHLFPATFKASFHHPTESLFVPALFVSFGLILINICQYILESGTGYLYTVSNILFWINGGFSIISSSGIYLLMWSTQTFTIATMTPIWIFPAYPLLIMGPHAAVLASKLDPGEGVNIMIGGFTLQGIGFLVSLTIYAAFVYRLMTQKLPPAALRPGMFVSVGPAAFTCAGIVNIAYNAGRQFPVDFLVKDGLAVPIVQVVAYWAGLWLWGLAIWFFIISCGAHYSCIGHNGGLKFGMTWYSFVFPNAAMATSTFAIGKVFKSKAIQVVGGAMTIILVGAWIVIGYCMIVAIIKKDILWPQKGEDGCEPGFMCMQPDCEKCVGAMKMKVKIRAGNGQRAWVASGVAGGSSSSTANLNGLSGGASNNGLPRGATEDEKMVAEESAAMENQRVREQREIDDVELGLGKEVEQDV
ncbi:hypothetical protein MMC25_004455 [Agyrium rufum]|nr:hypothetical protein [Agyrium rufum]